MDEKLMTELLAKTKGGPFGGVSITEQESYVVNDALLVMQRAKRLLEGKEECIRYTEEKRAMDFASGDERMITFYDQDLDVFKNEARILRLIIDG